jgi:hypothetical protein
MQGMEVTRDVDPGPNMAIGNSFLWWWLKGKNLIEGHLVKLPPVHMKMSWHDFANTPWANLDSKSILGTADFQIFPKQTMFDSEKEYC